MRKQLPPLVTVLPEITLVRERGNNDLYFAFAHPLNKLQTDLLRSICQGSQHPEANFVFSYGIIKSIPEEKKGVSSRQCNTGGTVLHMARSSGKRAKPSLESIALHMAQKMSAYSC